MEVLKGAIGSLIRGRLVRAAEQIEATRPESETSGTRPRSLMPRQLWEKLANELLPERESHVIEASRAAEAMGEPLSASPEPPVRAKAAAKFAGEIVQQYEDMRDYSLRRPSLIARLSKLRCRSMTESSSAKRR